jgi:hypothetical protein
MAREGTLELQRRSLQLETLTVFVSPPVPGVSHDRKAEHVKMPADLVAATGSEKDRHF